MCRSLRDTPFFARFASRRSQSTIDLYSGFPNALTVQGALNAIHDAAEAAPFGQSTRLLGRQPQH
eukprot:6206115-Pleurochrysis_carterae.AAC.2